MKIISALVMGLSAVAVILCLLLSFRFINRPSTATLLIFNALFISLTFQLNGSFNRKLCLLALGNITGLCWTFIFTSFANAGIVSFGATFSALYTVFFPFLSSLWIVSFWSLSLTVLHRENPPHGASL